MRIAKKRPKHNVYERENGHVWCKPNSCIQWDYCSRCLSVRQRGKPSKPCKGPARLRV